MPPWQRWFPKRQSVAAVTVLHPTRPLPTWVGPVIDEFPLQGVEVPVNQDLYNAMLHCLIEHGLQVFNGEQVSVAIYNMIAPPQQPVSGQQIPQSSGFDEATREAWWICSISCPGRTMNPHILVKLCMGLGFTVRILPYQMNPSLTWVPMMPSTPFGGTR